LQKPLPRPIFAAKPERYRDPRIYLRFMEVIMGLLQIQDVFDPYYAGKEAARSGPANLNLPSARPDESGTPKLASHRQRLELLEKRFASAVELRKPER